MEDGLPKQECLELLEPALLADEETPLEDTATLGPLEQLKELASTGP